MFSGVSGFKESWNLPSNFPDLKKVWKNGKRSWVLFNLQQVLFKCFFFFFDSFQSYPRPYVLQCIVKKALFLRFLRSILITYLITSSLEKVLNFWSQNLYEPFVWKCSKHECPWNNPRRYKKILLIKAPFLRFVLVLCYDPKLRLRMTICFVRISDGLPPGIKGLH